MGFVVLSSGSCLPHPVSPQGITKIWTKYIKGQKFNLSDRIINKMTKNRLSVIIDNSSAST